MNTQLAPRKTLHAGLNDSVYVREHWEQTAEEIYEDVAFRNVIGNDKRLQTSGVAYARKAHELGSAMDAKNAARQRILDTFTREQWPGSLRILTMPGLEWTFEKALIHARDFPDGERVPNKIKTRVYAVEYDPAIFFASLKWIPGHKKGISQLSPHCIRTNTIKCYYFTDAESFITDPDCPSVDAAWLDFTGYMTPRRLCAIRRFWHSKCARQITITFLNARYPSYVSALVKRHGGMTEWIAKRLGGQLADVHRYFDEHSAMLQITMRRDEANEQMA